MFKHAASFAGEQALLAVAVIVALALAAMYLARRGRVAPKVYSPRLAWLRAGIYFCACLIVADVSGVLGTVLTTPLATPEQFANPVWLAWTLGCVAVIVIGYPVIWAKGTFTDGRALHPFLAPAYGAVWGACQALMFLSFWALAEKSGLGVWWVAAISYVLIGAYNGVWHRFFWDIYVSPPHNYTAWNAKKVLFAHTPNLLVCLSYLAVYGNAGIYVLLQAFALAASAWCMRFPAPWDPYTATAGEER